MPTQYAHDAYLALKPDDASAWNRAGTAFQNDRRRSRHTGASTGRFPPPDDFAARLNRANLFFELERFEEAAQ